MQDHTLARHLDLNQNASKEKWLCVLGSIIAAQHVMATDLIDSRI